MAISETTGIFDDVLPPRGNQQRLPQSTNAQGTTGIFDDVLQNTPVDAQGFPIDLSRPLIENPDGSFSTERGITIQDSRLNEGRVTNIPSIIGGREVDQDQAIQAAVSSGQRFPSFGTIDEAVSASKARSELINQLRSPDTQDAESTGIFDDVLKPGTTGLFDDVLGVDRPTAVRNFLERSGFDRRAIEATLADPERVEAIASSPQFQSGAELPARASVGTSRNPAQVQFERGLRDEPPALSAIGRGGKQNIQATSAISAAFFGTDLDTAAQRIAEQERVLRANPPSQAVSDFFNSEGFLDSASAFAANPFEITSQIIGESLGMGAVSLGGAAAATAAGGPIAGAAAIGAGTLANESGAKILEAFREAGVDLTDERQIVDAFSNPGLVSEARAIALRKGVPIAAMDAFSFGIAGKFFRPIAQAFSRPGVGQLAGAAGEVGIQSVLGAGGEALGQTVAGEELNAPSILAEAIGEVGAGSVEIVTASAGRQSSTPSKIAVEPVELAPAPPTPTVPQTGRVLPAPARRVGEVAVPVMPSPAEAPPATPRASGTLAENPTAIARKRARETGVPKMPVAEIKTASGATVRWTGPMDLISWLRTQGGLKDQGGELSASGITNQPRDFVLKEGFVGPIINPNGMNLDDAALMAWQSGYFPSFAERPTVADFLDALSNTNNDTGRVFTQEDIDLMEGFQAERDFVREADQLEIDIRGLSDQEIQASVEQEIARQLNTLEPVSQQDLDVLAPIQGEILSPGGQQVLRIAGRPTRQTRAANINLEKLESVEDIRSTLTTVANEINIDEATRGVQSNRETLQLARDLGMNFQTLTSRLKGQAMNAEQAVAARELVTESAENLVRLAQQARNGSDQQLLEFQKAYRRHLAIQEAVTGGTAEAGRALQSFNIPVKSQRLRDLAIKSIISNEGGRTRIEDLAGAIASLDDPSTLNNFVRKSDKATLRQKLFEIWINGLLSSPKTHAVNALSNSLVALWEVPETLVAAGLGAFRNTERVYAGEAARRVFGLLQGSKEGAVLAGRTLMTEIPSDPNLKIEAQRQRAIGGRTGQVVRIPGRMLMASDDFFKAINRRSELYALAYRDAVNKGLKGQDRSLHIENLLTDPPEKLRVQADAFAAKQTFTNPLGPIGQNVMSLANRVNIAGLPAGRVVLPFIRTPSNIIKFAAERSAFGLLMKQVRDDMSGVNGKVARDQATARMGLGTTVSLAVMGLAAEGLITGGGPSDPDLRNALRLTGWQPYSLKVGDTYVSYQRLEPLGLLLGVSADFAQIAGELDQPEADKIGGMIIGSIAQNLVSKTWLSGLADLIQAVQDHERYGERYIRRLSGSLVPAGVANVARDGIPGIFSGDPILRDVRSIEDALLNRIPGYSTTLPPRRNIFGEPIALSGGLGPDLISPLYSSVQKNDPVADEIARLKLRVSLPNRKIGGIELTPEQYDQLQIITGSAIRTGLDSLVSNPKWDTLPNGIQKDFMSDIITLSRRLGRESLQLQNPEIVVQSIQQKVQELVGE